MMQSAVAPASRRFWWCLLRPLPATIRYGRQNSDCPGTSLRLRLRIRKTRGTLWQCWRCSLSVCGMVKPWLLKPERGACTVAMVHTSRFPS